MTSNVGVSSLAKATSIGFDLAEDKEEADNERNKEIITKAIKDSFAPEFLNRLDGTIMFNSLSQANIREITSLMLEKTRARLNEIGIEIAFDERVVNLLAKEGFNSEYGARPLERHITKMIDDRLAEDILDNKLDKDMTIRIYVQNDRLCFRNITKSKKASKEARQEVKA